ncbi:MAG: hypothetical protein ABJN12_05355, partial [Shimia thalassica]|uniref:hypothetical protein n=1 Tax=Shimia thalassica TaxID=1715693 RepID=UPI0032970C7A
RNPLHKPQKFLPSFTHELPSAAPSGVPRCISAPPVKGVLRLLSKSRNPFLAKTTPFLKKSVFSRNSNALHNFQNEKSA